MQHKNSVGHMSCTYATPCSDISQFLCFLNEHFTLAMWTSAKLKKSNNRLDLLLTTCIRSTLLFIWGQDAREFKRTEDNEKGLFLWNLYAKHGRNVLYGMIEKLC